MMTRNRFLWILWALATVLIAGSALARLYIAGDRTVLLPGQTAGAHHQLEIACETCHTSAPFASAAKLRKDINKTCVTCHKEDLKAGDDSHPLKKFTNPRMAAYWEKIDGRFCISCHTEHQPETTLPMMLTLQGDYCIACHSEGEQDIRKDRESHAELTFDTCAGSGCHNYHDNRALYEDFLVKHAGQPWLAETPVHPVEALARTRPAPDPAAIEAYLAGVSAADAARSETAAHDWAASAHAGADVGCAGCHAAGAETDAQIAAAWTDTPAETVCATCHKGEAKTFALGRHGTRRHPEIAEPRSAKSALKKLGWKKPPEALVSALDAYLTDPAPPAAMSVAEGRVPLKPEAHGETLTCSTCHAPHRQDLGFAAVGACVSCHDDDHSRAYEGSPHHLLWQAELAGDLPPGSGVTCATCHMPKTKSAKAITTNHNQNDTLRPNEKMIRPVCAECHGLGFAIDALADPALIANNFSGQPDRHVESIDWAVNRVEPPEQGTNQ
jgi:predicted CXXCH cytochrome family protein